MQATLGNGLVNTVVIPCAIVPLNVSECMCSSLEDVAVRSGGTLLEPECHTNQQCNGIICEIDILGDVYYIENIILPWDHAVDVVIEDSLGQPTFLAVFNRTESHPITVGFLNLILNVEIIMEISVS